MERIGLSAGRSLDLAASPKPSGEINAQRMLTSRQQAKAMPQIIRTLPDVEIPRRCWDAWREAGRPRYLRRPLTEDETGQLIARRDELAPWVCGFHQSERDEVMLAVADMLNAFATASMSDTQAVTKLDAIARRLSALPKWAIELACEKAATRGYLRKDGERMVNERHWPPSDPELVELIEAQLGIYADPYHSAVALLTAAVQS